MGAGRATEQRQARKRRATSAGTFATQRSVSSRQHRLACTAPESFAPGDATFHAGWTLHRAPANRTDRMCEVMTVIYFADGTRVGPLDHPNRRFDRDAWLPGCEPGEPAASPKNPVLWRGGG